MEESESGGAENDEPGGTAIADDTLEVAPKVDSFAGEHHEERGDRENRSSRDEHQFLDPGRE